MAYRSTPSICKRYRAFPISAVSFPFSRCESEWRSRTGKDRTFWARGYYVSTVGLNEAVIRKYVRDQEDASRIAG